MTRFSLPYIIIYSQKFCDLITKLNNLSKPSMGLSIPPNIIILRYRDHPMNNVWLNHEKIHHYQFGESFGLSHLLGFVEFYYAKYILKLSNYNSYLYKSIEQEAHFNQSNLNYLKQRKLWNFVKYITYKPLQNKDPNNSL